MFQRSSESTHIIWSMLFVAGALVVSYMLTFDREHFLISFGDVGEVAAGEDVNDDVMADFLEVLEENLIDQGKEIKDLESLPQPVQGVENNDEVVSLSESLSTGNESIALSDVLPSQASIGQGTSSEFESPEPVLIDNKKFFSVQQLFAEGSELSQEGGVSTVNQGTLALQNTYERTNNGKFVLPQNVGVQDEVQYILKDERNTHYVYLGEYVPIVFDTVVDNGGTVVAIEDKVSINRGGFFGDSVWLISLPDYEARNKILVLTVFVSKDDTWLLQIDRDRFESGGSEYLVESFGQHYMR